MKCSHFLGAILIFVFSNVTRAEFIAAATCDASKTEALETRLNKITSMGPEATDAEVAQMCEDMFLMGNEYLNVIRDNPGAGFGVRAQPSACAHKAIKEIESKAESIYFFGPRCQKVANRHPLRYSGEIDAWAEKYTLGAQAIGFVFTIQ